MKHAAWPLWLSSLLLPGEGIEFGGHASGFCRSDPLEYFPRLPQTGLGFGDPASRQGAAAQTGQRVGFIPRAADIPGQVQGLVVRRLRLIQVAADPVQCPYLVEHLSQSATIAEITEYA